MAQYLSEPQAENLAGVYAGSARPVARALLILFLAYALLCIRTGPVRAADDTDALLDECVAGIDSNLAMIDHGTATYRLKSWTPLSSQPREWKLNVVLDHPRRRFESQTEVVIDGRRRLQVEHSVVTPDERIDYWPPLDERGPHSAHIVFLRPTANDRIIVMDPRQHHRNGWGNPPSFAWEIGYMRRTAPDSLSARRGADGLVEISFRPSVDETRGVYWISPGDGYALVRANEWVRGWAGPDPSSTYEAQFREANNGAFVVAYRHERDHRIVDGSLTPWREEEVWLEEIDLVTRPAPKTFTIHGLELPIGAPIHDKIHGREYRYGIGAVNEGQIEVGLPTGPMGLAAWLKVFNLAVGAVILVWMGSGLARCFDRRARGARNYTTQGAQRITNTT